MARFHSARAPRSPALRPFQTFSPVQLAWRRNRQSGAYFDLGWRKIRLMLVLQARTPSSDHQNWRRTHPMLVSQVQLAYFQNWKHHLNKRLWIKTRNDNWPFDGLPKLNPPLAGFSGSFSIFFSSSAKAFSMSSSSNDFFVSSISFSSLFSKPNPKENFPLGFYKGWQNYLASQ